jgi:antirestriction protein ArdC
MRHLRSHPTQRRDHYQELTDKIIAALEAGIAPWRRPWDPNACGGSNMPVNVATGHRYRGVNLFMLGMSPLTYTRRACKIVGCLTPRAAQYDCHCPSGKLGNAA